MLPSILLRQIKIGGSRANHNPRSIWYAATVLREHYTESQALVAAAEVRLNQDANPRLQRIDVKAPPPAQEGAGQRRPRVLSTPVRPISHEGQRHD